MAQEAISESEATETEPPAKRTSARPRRARVAEDHSVSGLPGQSVLPLTAVHGLTGLVPHPDHAQLSTITVPLTQTLPSPQVPMHLLHPKMLPEALLRFLRDLYLVEQNRAIVSNLVEPTEFDCSVLNRVTKLP